MSNFSRSTSRHLDLGNVEWRRLMLGRLAAGTAIAVFMATYLLMLPHFGILLTVLFGWGAAGMLGCAAFAIVFHFLESRIGS